MPVKGRQRTGDQQCPLPESRVPLSMGRSAYGVSGMSLVADGRQVSGRAALDRACGHSRAHDASSADFNRFIFRTGLAGPAFRTRDGGAVVKADDPVRSLGQALLEVLRTLPRESDARCEWVALGAEAKRRGKSTRQMRAWCLKHHVELRADNHRDSWVRVSDIDRAVAGLPAVTSPTRGDEIEEELEKAWGRSSRQAPSSPRSRGRST